MNTLFIKQWLLDNGVPIYWVVISRTFILASAVILLCFIVNYLTKKIIIRIVSHYVRRSRTQWDDIFLEKGVFNRLSHITPALVIFFSSTFVLSDFEHLIKIVKSGSYIYIITVSLFVINSFINALHEIYQSLPVSKTRHIKGYVQIVKIIIFFIGGIIILSVILGEPPYVLLAGLGAMTAVLLFVFRDTILGLVASIQLSENNMLKPEDYIVIPKDNIEGTVKEISLSSVKLLNPDNTISFVPTYSLVAQPFNNWAALKEANARRIKRSIFIDMRTIRFINEKFIKNLKESSLLNEELTTYIEEYSGKSDQPTNLGIFRKYTEIYLRKNPLLNSDFPFLIHQLQPASNGLPFEIYFFINEINWEKSEIIQSEIIEHLIAVMREFELIPFQFANQ
jgi:miniconductance mechanosensitive channel